MECHEIMEGSSKTAWISPRTAEDRVSLQQRDPERPWRPSDALTHCDRSGVAYVYGASAGECEQL